MIGIVLVAVVGWLNHGFMAPASWQLSLEARSELVSVQLAGRTKWDIGNAIVCAPVSDAGADTKPDGDDLKLCNSARWRVLRPVPSKNGRFLILSSTPGNEIDAKLKAYHDGSVGMSLSAQNKGQSLGMLTVTLDGGEVANALPYEANVFWNAPSDGAESRYTVLPFTGDVTIGRDVSWGEDRMLLGGRLSIFAASQESLAGRTLAEEAVLVLGDQVQLRAWRDSVNALVASKGFVRFNAGSSLQPFALDVVAFAPAEGATIVRFGGGEYSFSPSWWVKIKHKSTLVITLAVGAAVLTVLASLANILQFLPVGLAWCLKQQKRSRL